MRVAWVHPTWRDLVIERLAADAELRRHFLGRCGPHGVVLALSTAGGAAGGRALPLVVGDEDWDALGDRIYALIPELDHRELAAVLRALRAALVAARRDGNRKAGGEARALARMALERSAATWASAGTPVLLDCVDAWLSLSAQLDPPVWPSFLDATWADLLPAGLPEPEDLTEVQRFTDWVTLCDLLAEFSLELLGELGFSGEHNTLIRRFREGPRGESEILVWSGDPRAPGEEERARQFAETTVRRVLADL
jgi:hypothetical protein